MVLTLLMSSFLLVGTACATLQCRKCTDCAFGGTFQNCRCDAECNEYRDCCTYLIECNLDNFQSSQRRYDCISLSLNVSIDNVPDLFAIDYYYWMVSKCPEDWLMTNSAPDLQFVSGNCSHGEQSLLPVTDGDTGVVYKNEFCALCHRVQNLKRWRYSLKCSTLDFLEDPAFDMPSQDLLNMFCTPDVAIPPDNDTLLRLCYPHRNPQCQDQDTLGFNDSYYQFLVDQCENGYQNLVTASNTSDIYFVDPTPPYRNEYCALCNRQEEQFITCLMLPSPGFQGGLSFSLILDVNQDGLVVVSTEQRTFELDISCGTGEIFDPVVMQCRETLQPLSSNCIGELIALGQNDTFQIIDANTVLYNDEQYQIEYNTSNIEPVICVNFTQNGTQITNITVTIFSYPLGYYILTYIGCSLSVLGCVLLLVTYCCFRELLTLPSKILMNLATSILIADLLILIGGAIIDSFPNTEFCIAVAVCLHFFFLALFSWMTILCCEMTRTFYNAHRMRLSGSSKGIFIFYLFLGWGIPSIIVVVSLIVDYMTDNLVLYGVLANGMDGSCWINHFESAIVAFVAPVAFLLLLNLIFFTVIVILLCLASHSQSRLDKSNKNTPYIRVLIAIFFVSGLTWVFGFVAILIGTVWSWYPFIILNSTQGFVIFLAFLCTKKVGGLYLSLCKKRDRRPSTKESRISTKATLKSSVVSDDNTV